MKEAKQGHRKSTRRKLAARDLYMPAAIRSSRERPVRAVMEDRSFLARFLHSRYAPLITHLSLVILSVFLFGFIFWAPLWVALIPCALIHHRIGILLHEYIHGIPFLRYKHNLWILTAFDGLLLSFGGLEVFRGIHLAHHRWLNTEKDPVYEKDEVTTRKASIRRFLGFFEGSHYVKYMCESFWGKHRYVEPFRIAVSMMLSLAWVMFWIQVGSPRVVMVLVGLNLYTSMGPSSLRGALEHRSYRGDPSFANEYRVRLSLFNLNRHIHHHLDPTCPWYLLEFFTPEPLPAICYWTHWYHIFVRQDYSFMQPPRKRRPYRAEVHPPAPVQIC